MDEIGIKIARYEQLVPEDLNLFWASNGLFQGGIRFHLERGHLKRMGKTFSPFPDKIPGECSYSIGSQHTHDKSSYLMLRAYMVDNQGHTALQVVMNDKDEVPNEGKCQFSILAEPWAIHRLGELLQKFSDSKYCALNWSLNSDNDILEEWGPLPRGESLSKWLKEQWEWVKKNPPGPGDYYSP